MRDTTTPATVTNWHKQLCLLVRITELSDNNKSHNINTYLNTSICLFMILTNTFCNHKNTAVCFRASKCY